MKIIITGGAGFIGTNCVIKFAKNNQIVVIDNLSRYGVDKNAKFLTDNFTKIKIVKANVEKPETYGKFMSGADVIIHLAGQTAVTTSIADPMLDFRSNLLGTIKLLETARKKAPNAVLIYSSTNKVYGDLNRHKIKKNSKEKRYEDICHPNGLDENEKIDFISPYGCSKGASDFYFLDYARIYRLNTVVFRQSCIYGPHQIGIEDQGWVAHFAKQFIFKKPITIFGDGYQVRDLLFVDDLIDAYKLAIQKIKKIKGQVFNIGGGINNAYSILQVIEQLKKITGNNIKISFKKSRLGDQKYYVSSNEKVSKLLGWKPSTKFKDGLIKLVSWQKNNITI